MSEKDDKEDKIRKTDAQRQKSLYQRRKAQGWGKRWVDPGTMELAKRLGGIEHIPDAYSAQRAENDKLRANVEAVTKTAEKASVEAQEAKKKADEMTIQAEQAKQQLEELEATSLRKIVIRRLLKKWT